MGGTRHLHTHKNTYTKHTLTHTSHTHWYCRDFVEVYGQDKPPRAEEEGQTAQDAVGGVTSVSDAVKAASAGAASVSEQITDISVLEKLSKDMSEAIVRQDFAKVSLYLCVCKKLYKHIYTCTNHVRAQKTFQQNIRGWCKARFCRV